MSTNKKYEFIVNELKELDQNEKQKKCLLCHKVSATHVWSLFSETQKHSLRTCKTCYDQYKDDDVFLSAMGGCEKKVSSLPPIGQTGKLEDDKKSSDEEKIVDTKEVKVDQYGFKLNELTKIDCHVDIGEVPTNICELCKLSYATHVWHLCSETMDHHIQTCTICYDMFKNEEDFLSMMKTKSF